MSEKISTYFSLAILWIKVKWQRMQRGYSIIDSLNACDYIDYIIVGLLSELRALGTTFPQDYASKEEWNKVLDEAIDLLSLEEPLYIVEYNIPRNVLNEKNMKYFEDVEKWSKEKKRGRLIVVEIFDNLYD